MPGEAPWEAVGGAQACGRGPPLTSTPSAGNPSTGPTGSLWLAAPPRSEATPSHLPLLQQEEGLAAGTGVPWGPHPAARAAWAGRDGVCLSLCVPISLCLSLSPRSPAPSVAQSLAFRLGGQLAQVSPHLDPQDLVPVARSQHWRDSHVTDQPADGRTTGLRAQELLSIQLSL